MDKALHSEVTIRGVTLSQIGLEVVMNRSLNMSEHYAYCIVTRPTKTLERNHSTGTREGSPYHTINNRLHLCYTVTCSTDEFYLPIRHGLFTGLRSSVELRQPLSRLTSTSSSAFTD